MMRQNPYTCLCTLCWVSTVFAKRKFHNHHRISFHCSQLDFLKLLTNSHLTVPLLLQSVSWLVIAPGKEPLSVIDTVLPRSARVTPASPCTVVNTVL